MKSNLDWQTSTPSDATHSANDGVVTYYAVAPGLTLDRVATEFLRGYDAAEDAGDVEFAVTDLRTEDSLNFRGQPNQEADIKVRVCFENP